MEWDHIIKQAKSCRTKESWNLFLQQYQSKLAQTNQSKPIAEIFKILHQDKQSLRYNVELWVILLEGCIASWDLDLGMKIAQFTEKLTHPPLAIRSAEVNLERGYPATARRIAQRAIRLKRITHAEAIQLQLILCKSYVEEGRSKMALRLLDRLKQGLQQAQLEPPLQAEILTNMARVHYFLGNYSDAAMLFEKSYTHFEHLQNWEGAAKALFNAAACLHNSGSTYESKAFGLVQQCFELATAKGLKGPLSHCYAFYGTHEYQLGNFSTAARYYRQGLAAIPPADQSFRRLHILSMLTLAYMKKGQYRLAFRHGQKTMALASQDESSRFRSRYIGLEAEIKWHSGLVDESQNLLQTAVRPLQTQGVQTLEQLSALSRFYVQSSLLNDPCPGIRPKIANRLKEHTYAWLEYMLAKSDIHLTDGNFAEADRLAKLCYSQSQQRQSNYFANRALVNLVQAALARGQTEKRVPHLIETLEQALNQPDFERLRVQIYMARAGLAYRQGYLHEALRLLHSGLRCTGIPNSYRQIIKTWLATGEGRASRLTPEWKAQLVTRATRIYFAPTLAPVRENYYIVSNFYYVDLSSYPILAKLMTYLLQQKNYTATPEELQKNVWKQNLNLQGWQQKIRNAIMRLRSMFPFTIAPLILQDLNVRLNAEAVQILARNTSRTKATVSNEHQVLALLREKPHTSSQLSERLTVSTATTKRILKKLVKDDIVTVQKVGRHVLYTIDPVSHTSPYTPQNAPQDTDDNSVSQTPR
jgi:tetratricopeptide (TPR) repeat protein